MEGMGDGKEVGKREREGARRTAYMCGYRAIAQYIGMV